MLYSHMKNNPDITTTCPLVTHVEALVQNTAAVLLAPLHIQRVVHNTHTKGNIVVLSHHAILYYVDFCQAYN